MCSFLSSNAILFLSRLVPSSRKVSEIQASEKVQLSLGCTLGTRKQEHTSVIRRLTVCAMVTLFATLILYLPPSSADTERTTLRLHHFNSPKSIAHRLFIQPWADEVEKKSGGRVKIQVFPAMQLGGKPSDLYDQVRDGVVDIIWTIPGYTPGRFPLTEVFELPFLTGSAIAASQALTEFHQKWMRDEYKDTHPLVFHSTAPTHLHTTEKQIHVLEDMKGMKIRTPSRVSSETLSALGAIPVGMPVPAVYEALSRGVVEGTAIPWTIMRPFRLHEVTNYHTEVDLSRVLFVMTMNKQRYSELTPDAKAVIDSTTGMALAKRLGRMWHEDENPGRAIAVELNHQIQSLSEDEKERWREKTRIVVNSWVEKVSALGYDGRVLLEDAKHLLAKYGSD